MLYVFVPFSQRKIVTVEEKYISRPKSAPLALETVVVAETQAPREQSHIGNREPIAL